MSNSFKIAGLDCANCARELEEEISKISGVESATVDFMALKVTVDCDGETLLKVKELCNRFEEVKVVEDVSAKSDDEKINITGLCCANCARELEEDLNKIEGVTATVDFVNGRIILGSQNAEAREKALYTVSHFEDVKIVTDKPVKKSVFKEHLKDIVLVVISALFFLPALGMELAGIYENNIAAKITGYVFYGIAFLAVGHRVLINTVKNILKGKVFDENFLMTIASVGAILLGIFAGDGFAEGVAVMFLYQIGELLQSLAVGSSRDSISSLMDLKSETATLLSDGGQRVVSPETLQIGDKILIKNGEKVPVDCRVTKGTGALDMKSLNGESLPREVSTGNEILSGSINVSGVLEAEVIREYKNSAVAKILELVENSTSRKAQSEKFITKFAKYYTPAVCVAAVLLAALVPTVICAMNGAYIWETYRQWLYTSLNLLVISCPCALVISVPLSYFCGIGKCAKSGILVKGSTCLDALATATVAAFDKTGTLTEGTFEVVGYTNEKALHLAAAAEKFSAHPIAAAFAEIKSEYSVSEAEEVAGKGIKCICDGKTLLVGNRKFLSENGVEFVKKESVSTLVYVSLGGKYVGVIEIDDKIKDGVKEALNELGKSGINYKVMLTGDLPERAEAVAFEIGLDGYEAALLPDGKLEKALALKEKGGLLYVGDGINDAPVMTAADCAVSMGKVGSDAAIEASDVVLVSDKISLLPKGRKIAKRTRAIVMQNIIASLAVKFAVMALSIALPAFPMFAAIIADVGVMLAAVFNALRVNIG